MPAVWVIIHRMKPRPKLRKIVKWMSLIFSTLLAVVWIGSAWIGIGWAAPPSTHHIIIAGGSLTVSRSGVDLGNPFGSVVGHFSVFQIPVPGLYPWNLNFIESPARNFWLLSIPLWILLFFSAAGTVFIWRRDRMLTVRELAWSCGKCNYDRRGIDPTIKCPECGAIPAE